MLYICTSGLFASGTAGADLGGFHRSMLQTTCLHGSPLTSGTTLGPNGSSSHYHRLNYRADHSKCLPPTRSGGREEPICALLGGINRRKQALLGVWSISTENETMRVSYSQTLPPCVLYPIHSSQSVTLRKESGGDSASLPKGGQPTGGMTVTMTGNMETNCGHGLPGTS